MTARPIVLANGISMPSVGLGTYQMNLSNLEIALPAALDAGYRSFDTAASYKNEQFIGEIFALELSKRGLTRRDIFITTKLRPADQGYEKALAAICQSATFLGGYIDLYLIHWPGAAKVKPSDDLNRVRRIETWRALQDVYLLHHKRIKIDDSSHIHNHTPLNHSCTSVEQPTISALSNTVNMISPQSDRSESDVKLLERLQEVYVRAIGVSNFNVYHIESLVAAPHFQVYPHVNQCEIHPAYHPPDMRAYCEEHAIHLQAYSSLGCGKLLESQFLEYFPQIQNMASERIASLLEMSTTWTGDDSVRLGVGVGAAEVEILKTCTVGIYLRWALQHGYSIIPKSCNPQRIRDNYVMATDLTLNGLTAENKGFQLSMDDMNYLDGMVTHHVCEKLCWDGSPVS